MGKNMNDKDELEENERLENPYHHGHDNYDEQEEGGNAESDFENHPTLTGHSSSRSGLSNRALSFGPDYKMPTRRGTNALTTFETLVLAYQSLGVVYGDIGTSPLYVFSSISLENPTERDILGILSLIFWTLTLIGLVKYVCIVLHADDHGEGGTFALYSILRQNINFKGKMVMPMHRLASDANLKYYSKRDTLLRNKAHEFFENNSTVQTIITFLVLLGTCMVIGDGALTPAISVLSAVQGIQSRSPKITQDYVVGLSVAILLILFLFQRFGTNKVSFTFSPITIIWFGMIAVIGIYNIIRFYPPIFKAVSPHYIYYFFQSQKAKGWYLLGAIALCITGAEAMFADLGHFSRGSIQLAFSAAVYPSLIIAYAGQAAFLIKNPGDFSTAFYSSVPHALFWPMFAVATLAAIVASQALISASFSIIRQSIALDCFPRVTMVHTSADHEGQVYSPEINYFLMISCILITIGFKGGAEIGNAYGVAVIWVMLITSFLMMVVMIVVWETNVPLALLFFFVYFIIEGVYMTSLLTKLLKGGWVPFAITAVFLIITLSWTYGRSKKAQYEADKRMDRKEFDHLMAHSLRMPGVCFFCTDLINGVPPIVRHYSQLIGSLRNVTVFVTVRTLPVRNVLPNERLLVGKIGPRGVYRCLVQFGYMDSHTMVGDEYARSVVAALRETTDDEEEIHVLESVLNDGVVFVTGRTILRMSDHHGWFKNFVIDNLYRFLQKNFRSNVATLKIPTEKQLQVGMLYQL